MAVAGHTWEVSVRFFFAFLAFVLAAALIAVGFAQRTFLVPASSGTLSVQLPTDVNYVFVPSSVLHAHVGEETMTVSGASSVFIGYGSEADVSAWVGSDPSVTVTYDPPSRQLVLQAPSLRGSTNAVKAAPSAVSTAAAPSVGAISTRPKPVSPAGSDLWYDEYTGKNEVDSIVDPRPAVGAIIASGTSEPISGRLTIRYPQDTSTPWAGPFMALGVALFVVGVLLFILALRYRTRGSGPRRTPPPGGRIPRRPSKRALRRAAARAGAAGTTVILVGALAGVLGLTGCTTTAAASVDLGRTATATPSPRLAAALTITQITRITRDMNTLATKADTDRNVDLLSQRFSGSAYESRKANYAIRGADGGQPGPIPIPVAPFSVQLPQQATGWPRSAFVIGKGTGTNPPTIAMMMTQASPRDNYKINNMVTMLAGADVKVSDAATGAPLISPDFKGLVLQPSQIPSNFADVLQNGSGSQFANQFDVSGTDLIDKFNVTARTQAVQGASPTISLSVSTAPTSDPVIVLSTDDAGAIVTATVSRIEQSRPNDGGTTGFAAGSPARALSGYTGQSAKGVQLVRVVQLLFHVPTIGSSGKVTLLGFSENLVAASELTS